MSEITLQSMLEAGVHFGHQTARWNPKMSQYIFGSRNGIHIIDLQKTLPLYERARQYVKTEAGRGGNVRGAERLVGRPSGFSSRAARQ